MRTAMQTMDRRLLTHVVTDSICRLYSNITRHQVCPTKRHGEQNAEHVTRLTRMRESIAASRRLSGHRNPLLVSDEPLDTVSRANARCIARGRSVPRPIFIRRGIC